MTLKWHLNFFIAFAILLATEISIAVCLSSGFIRHTFGDYLVVILIYCFFRSFLDIKPLVLGTLVLLFSFTVEFLQWFNLLDLLHLRSYDLAVIVLGSTFHIGDLIAYALGVCSIILIDLKTRHACN